MATQAEVQGTHRFIGLAVTRIDKDELLTTIKSNRKRHLDAFNSALTVFNKELAEKLETAAKGLKGLVKSAGESTTPEMLVEFRTKVHEITSPVHHILYPEQHLDDYDKTIRKLEMSIDKVVDLNDDEFNRYVMDNWAWKSSWTSNTVMYAGKAGK